MIGRAGSAWQTTTADLALILFLVVSAAGAAGHDAEGRSGAPQGAMATTPPVGVYRHEPGTSVTQWLDAQAADDRQVATVVVRQVTAGPSPALDDGLAMLAEIESAGRRGRLLIEKSAVDEVVVVLAYDDLAMTGTALAAR